MIQSKRLFAVLSIGAGLRLFQLWKAPLWYDETFSASLSRLPLLDMLQATAGDVHPPLYQLLIWPIGQLGGGAFWFRSLSVVCSVVSLYLLWLICKQIRLSDTCSLVAVGLAAITPLDLHFAQEARQYALLQMLDLAGVLAVLKRRWLWICITGTAMLYTHNYGGFYLAAMGAASLAIELLYTTAHPFETDDPRIPTIKSAFPTLLHAYAAPVILWLPWVFVLAGQMRQVAGGYWIQFTWGNVLYVINCLFWGFGLPEQAQPVAVFILAAILFLALLAARKDRLYIPVWFGLAPLAMAVIVSLVWQPVLLFRGLVGSAPFLYILVANLITRPGSKSMRYAVLATLLPILLVGVINHYIANPANKDGGTSAILSLVDDHYKPGDLLVYTNDAAAVMFGYNRPQMQGAVIADCQNLGGLSSRTRQAMGIQTVQPADLPTGWHGYLIYIIGPTSSQCEEDAGDLIAASSTLVREYKDDDLTTVRVYQHGGDS